MKKVKRNELIKRGCAVILAIMLLGQVGLFPPLFARETTSVNATIEESGLKSVREVASQGKELKTEKRVEYRPVNSPLGISLKAYAKQGVLPEGVFLKVQMDDEDSVLYKEAEKELIDNAIDYDDFMAMDIGFYDKEGKEIEPEKGSVEIEIELSSSILPEDVDEETLAVQHHGKTATGIKLETVAEATEGSNPEIGKVNPGSETIKANFSVESFSTFTITWGSSSRTCTIHYIDKDGHPLVGKITGSQSLSNGEIIIFNESYVGSITGYTYQGAYRSSNITSSNQIQRVRRNSIYLQYSTSTSGTSWDGTISNGGDIYLVYEQDPVVTPTPQLIKEAVHEKYVEAKGDGTYDLSLSIAGAAGSITHPSKLDIIFVLDISGSMIWNMSSDSGSSNQRRDAAARAIETFSETLVNKAEIDARFSLVTFSGSTSGTWNDASTAVPWTSNANAIIYASATVPPDGGTNYQAGLRNANALLESVRVDATKAVIFISDGDPTFRYTSTGSTIGSGNVFEQASLDAGKAEAAKLQTDFFFTVGVGRVSNYTRLQQLNEGLADPAYIPGVSTANNYFAGEDEEDLKQAFDTIMGTITSVLCENVTITDRLSENVDITNPMDPNYLGISILDEGGNVVASGTANSVEFEGATITATYDEETKTVKMNFPSDYQLKNGHTYKVTMNIVATEKAYEDYRDNGEQYVNRGGAYTGVTSAGKLGVFTNEEAAVTYTYDGEEVTSVYPHPVIQLNPGSLIIEKEISGLADDSEALNKLLEKLKFKYYLKGPEDASFDAGTEIIIDPDEMDYVGDVYQYTLKGLQPGTQYYVEEIGADISEYGYDLTTTIDSIGTEAIPAVVGKDEVKVAKFTNTYIPSAVLTIEKQVIGNLGDISKEFSFSLNLTDAEAKEYQQDLRGTKGIGARAGSPIILTYADGKYSFTLKDEEWIKIPIPKGLIYKVVEQADDYEVSIKNGSQEPQLTDTLANQTITEDTTVIFTNKKELLLDLVVTKTDEEGELIEKETEFKLECTSPIYNESLTESDGVFDFADLGPGIYTLTEVKAPEGYILLENPIIITISNDGAVTIDGEPYTMTTPKIIELHIANIEAGTETKFIKVGADDINVGLGGAEFALYRWTGSGTHNAKIVLKEMLKDGDWVRVKKDGEIATAITDVFTSSSIPGPTLGEVDLGKLPNGIYTLIETKVPGIPGQYELPAGQWVLTIDNSKRDSGTSWKIEFNSKSSSIMPPAATRIQGSNSGNPPIYKIINAKPFTIGLSGMGGTRGMLIVGVALMMVAGSGYTILSKKKQRYLKR